MATSEFSSGVARIIAKQAVIGRGAERLRARSAAAWWRCRLLAHSRQSICAGLSAVGDSGQGGWCLAAEQPTWPTLKVDVRVTEGTLAPDCCQARHYLPSRAARVVPVYPLKPKSSRSAPDGDAGPSRLALGPVAHRVDHGDPCDGCRGTDIRGDADTVPTGKPRRRVVEPDRDPDLHNRSNRIAVAMLHGIECVIWAGAYLWLGALDSPMDALLYSVDSMSTRGASGLTLQGPWQLMGPLEAIDGMLLFGVSTAYIFSVMQAYWSMLTAHVAPRKS